IEASEGVAAFELAHPDGGDLPPWQPGAHLDVHVSDAGGAFVRQYSLCSDPADLSRYRIGVLREVAGRGGSAAVHETLADGATVTVSWPRNNFRLVPAKSYVYIAGGIGITPILGMVREADRAASDWRLIYGGRTRKSMAFLDELAAFGDRVMLVP